MVKSLNCAYDLGEMSNSRKQAIITLVEKKDKDKRSMSNWRPISLINVDMKIYFFKQLKRANIPAKDLLIFYLTCIRPVTEYACPVFHNALPAYLSAELEQLQKRAMRIIFPFVPYSDALHQANLEALSRRRQSITTKLFDSITCNSDHKLHELLPPRNNFNVPLAKTKRLKNTFIYSNCN